MRGLRGVKGVREVGSVGGREGGVQCLGIQCLLVPTYTVNYLSIWPWCFYSGGIGVLRSQTLSGFLVGMSI